MRRRLPANLVLLMLLLLLLFFGSASAMFASSILSSQDRAIAYLADVQSSSGYWDAGHQLILLDTYALSLALRHYSRPLAEAALWRATAGLLDVREKTPGLEKNLFSALLLAAAAGEISPDDLLAWRQDETSGWSLEQGGAPDLLATLLVLELVLCLVDAETLANCSVWREGAQFLVQARASDGHWRFSPWAAPGDFRLTCRVASVLAIYDLLTGDGTLLEPTALSELGDLACREMRAHGWLDEAGTAPTAAAGNASFYDAAMALQLLTRLGRWDEAAAIGQKLKSRQLPDGSWREANGSPANDLQTTAAVLMALAPLRMTTPTAWPDLMLVAEGVECRWQNDGSLTVNALIFNQGSAAAETFQVSVYQNWPTLENLLAQQEIPRLAAGSSAMASFFLRATEWPSHLVLVADIEGAIPDLERGNNLCYCQLPGNGDWPMSPSPYLAILEPGILCNGKRPDEVTFLAPGRGTRLSAQLLLEGDFTAVQYTFSGNGHVIVRPNLTLPPSAPNIEISAEWFPSAGEHEVRLQVIGNSQDENRIFEDSVIWQTIVVAEGAWLQTWRQVEQVWQPESNFAAREYVELEVKCADQDAIARLWVENAGGEYLGQAVPALERSGRWHWHTGAVPPGEYVAKGQFLEPRGGALLAEAEVAFQVMATAEFSDLVLHHTLPSSRLPSGQQLSFAVTLQWQAVCNQQFLTAQASCHWEYDDGHRLPEGLTAAHHFPLELSTVNQRLDFPAPLAVQFPAPGNYTLVAQLQIGDTLLTQRKIFQAVVQAQPQVFNDVSPSLVEAAGTLLTTRIQVCLPEAGSDLEDDMPVSFMVGDFSPMLPDDSASSLTVPLREIRGREQDLIAQGTLISIVEYGRCAGDLDLAPARRSGSVSLHQVWQGTALLHYTPAGEALRRNQWATVVIAIYQAAATENGWLLKKRLGEVELFLEGIF